MYTLHLRRMNSMHALHMILRLHLEGFCEEVEKDSLALASFFLCLVFAVASDMGSGNVQIES
jgi:hypothetical protein